MRWRGLAWPALVVALVLAGGVAGAQWQKNEYQLQREAAARYEPAPLVLPPRPGGGPVQTLRIRFYADDDFRSGGGLKWQDRLRVQLAELNRVVEPGLGVRFEPESFRRWQRSGPSGALAPMLVELERLDPGSDVDWVVG